MPSATSTTSGPLTAMAYTILTDALGSAAIPWVWTNRIARGALTLVAGEPDTGKSTLLLDLIARLASGRPLPVEEEGSSRPPMRVLMVLAEDSVHRAASLLSAAGAGLDAGRIACIHKADIGLLPGAASALEEAVRDHEASVLLIDPILAVVRQNAARAGLTALTNIAEHQNCAVVAVHHLRKSGSGNPIHALKGDLDIPAASRSILQVIRDPDERAGPADRVLVQIKQNWGPASSLGFRIEAPEGLPIIKWMGEHPITARDLGGDPEDYGALEQAKHFLVDLLADRPLRANSVLKRAAENGLSRKTVNRAKRALGVRSSKLSGLRGAWVWVLPVATGALLIKKYKDKELAEHAEGSA